MTSELRSSPLHSVVAGLRRESSSGTFIPEIDGLRFVAILSVVLYHLNGFVVVKSGRTADPGLLSGLLDRGSIGVQLFFVISGFIISLPFAKRALQALPAASLRAYYVRRLTRLEPPYLVNLLLLFCLTVVVKEAAAGAMLPHLLASAFYGHNLIFDASSLINGVAWSLEVEFQFYLLAPLFVLVFRIRAPHRRRTLLVALIALCTWIGASSVAADVGGGATVLRFAQYFLTGFLLADLYLNHPPEGLERRWAWDLISLCAWLALAALLYAPKPYQALLPLPIVVAYWGAFRGRAFNRVFRHPAVYLVGGMCYTIYLYHFLIISAVGNPVLSIVHRPGWPVWANLIVICALVVPATLAVSAILFAAFERPFMARGWHVALMERVRARGSLAVAEPAQRP